MAFYDVGDKIRLTGTFAVAGTATDPTTVTGMTRTPAGVETSYVYGVDAAMSRTSTGVYNLDVTLNAPGVWRLRLKGTGACVAADEVEIIVDASGFTTP